MWWRARVHGQQRRGQEQLGSPRGERQGEVQPLPLRPGFGAAPGAQQGLWALVQERRDQGQEKVRSRGKRPEVAIQNPQREGQYDTKCCLPRGADYNEKD